MAILDNETSKYICKLYDEEISRYESISELFNKIKNDYEVLVYNSVIDDETSLFQEEIFCDIMKKISQDIKYSESLTDIKEFILNPNLKIELEATNESLTKSGGQNSLQDVFFIRKISSCVLVEKEDLKDSNKGYGIKVDRILLKDSQNMNERVFLVNVDKIELDFRKYEILKEVETKKLEDRNIQVTPKISAEIDRKAKHITYMISSLEKEKTNSILKKDKSKKRGFDRRFENARLVRNWYDFTRDFKSQYGLSLDENIAYGDEKSMMISNFVTSDYLILDNRKKRRNEIITLLEQYKKTIPINLKKVRK